jgi:predicted 3-demethylubiquinone-9 3-methyltransferase (glyoxalase superfamily)
VPDTALAERIAVYGHGPDNDRAAMLADEFGVSYGLMRRRLAELSAGGRSR